MPGKSRRSLPGPAFRAWQRMLSGRRLDLLDPSPLDIEIEDIAHGLARVARWNGQTEGAHIFSVAQHSLLAELIARQRLSLDRSRRRGGRSTGRRGSSGRGQQRPGAISAGRVRPIGAPSSPDRGRGSAHRTLIRGYP